MIASELATILESHRRWRRGELGGSRADLTDANLTDANLAGANLAGADLTDANLTDANLADANLAGADLADAYLADANLADANLAGADLTGAYLADANLAGADLTDANLAGANLAGARNLPTGVEAKNPAEPYVRKLVAETLAARAERYRQRHPEIPVVERLDAKILDAITVGGGKLDMGRWHSCETTHCRAGWAITLAGDAGRKLEEEHGPQRAGAMIYRASTGRAPFFFAKDAVALEDIRKCAAEQTEPAEGGGA
jgi:hypothetical protein